MVNSIIDEASVASPEIVEAIHNTLTANTAPDSMVAICAKDNRGIFIGMLKLAKSIGGVILTARNLNPNRWMLSCQGR
ncbi:hypothetical protein TK45_13540 [Bowmanella sp. JS7-9]|nr:hypothetical protein TK45_13540 [Bowmanella sp. JS7-9]